MVKNKYASSIGMIKLESYALEPIEPVHQDVKQYLDYILNVEHYFLVYTTE